MRTIILLALLASVVVAFNIFRDNENEQFLSVVRKARDAADSDSKSSEEDNQDGSGSGDSLKRVAREASGDGDSSSSSSSSEEDKEVPEGSGVQVTSAPLRFVRAAELPSSSEESKEGSGSGDDN